jgi:hypothetical protein
MQRVGETPARVCLGDRSAALAHGAASAPAAARTARILRFAVEPGGIKLASPC